MSKKEKIELYKRLFERHGLDMVLAFLVDVIEGEQKEAKKL
jgi:hypothetical protein